MLLNLISYSGKKFTLNNLHINMRISDVKLEIKNVTKIPYDKSILYNILLDKHSVINVNNMVCETLHPDNIIAKLYTRFSDKHARNEIVYKLNKYLKNKDYASYKSILNRIENAHI